MKESSTSLPDGFAALEPYVATWTRERAAERVALRIESSAADREAFYSAAVGLLPAALTYLDARSLNELTLEEQRLMQLMLSLAHISLAVEVQGKDEPVHALNARHVRILGAPSERRP